MLPPQWIWFTAHRATSAAASARPARPRKSGMNPTTVAVVPDRFAELITDVVTGIATATIMIVPKMTLRTAPPT